MCDDEERIYGLIIKEFAETASEANRLAALLKEYKDEIKDSEWLMRVD